MDNVMDMKKIKELETMINLIAMNITQQFMALKMVSHTKETRIQGRNSKSGARNIQSEPGISYITIGDSKEATKSQYDHGKRT